MKKFLKITGILLLITAILFFALAPGIIDRSMNKVVHTSAGIVKVNWYDSIPFIADYIVMPCYGTGTCCSVPPTGM